MAEDMRVLGVLSANGNPTGDKRTITKPSLRWALPMPLRRAREDFGGHNGAVVVGSITDIKQAPTGELMYSAVLHDTPDGLAAYDEMYQRYAASGLKYGVSVDLDDVVMVEDPDDPAMALVESGRLRGATLCDIPAYRSAYAVLASQIPQSLAASALSMFEVMDQLFYAAYGQGLIEEVGIHESPNGDTIRYEIHPGNVIVAAGTPRANAPRAWFQNPMLAQDTPMTVTPEGRIFGHCALWKSCHTGYGNVCVTPPRSATNYAYFNTGAVVTAEGDLVPVGHITMGVGHADPRMAAMPAAEHYDNVNSIMADVTAGEDEFGIWLSGAVREGITEAQVRELLATAPSGDWRTINGNLEMVAVLNVVSPGFPVPRMRAMVASGEIMSLVASACFDTEAAVEDHPTDPNDAVPETPVAEEAAVEVEPSVDVAEVAPEDVAAAMAPAEPEAEAPAEDAPAEEAPVEEESPAPAADLAQVIGMITELQAAIAELKASAPATESPADPQGDIEVVDAVPAIEHSAEDMLKALDALVQQAEGNKPSVLDVLAQLDAKVGQ